MPDITASTPEDHNRSVGRSREGHSAEQLFVALECRRPLARSSRHVLTGVSTVVLGRGDRRDAERRLDAHGRTLRVSLDDHLVSSAHARLFRLTGDRFVLEDAGSKNGTYVNGKAVKRAVLLDGDVIEVGQTLLLYRDAVAPVKPDVLDLDSSQLEAPAPGLATFVATLGDSFAALARAAPSPISIVIFGDTGTGKEVVARAAHALSRRAGPFVAVNCGALPAALVEASIFGHRKGAFSGAIEDRPGLVRSADRGTLFLDELGELPRASQVAFLRVLQEREVVPVGDARPVRVDVRLISATHRSALELERSSDFRDDFFARISGLTVRLPSLADRREDLGLLVASLLERFEGGEVKLTPRAALALFRYRWPLNVRELEKALGAATVLSDGTIELRHLPEALLTPAPVIPGMPGARDSDPSLNPADRRVREELVALLNEHRGNVSAVARAMGKGRMQVHRWLKRFSLELKRFRDEP